MNFKIFFDLCHGLSTVLTSTSTSWHSHLTLMLEGTTSQLTSKNLTDCSVIYLSTRTNHEMAKHHDPDQGPNPITLPYASRPTSTQPMSRLMPYPVVQQAIGEAFRAYQPYGEIIERGGHLAPLFEDSLFHVEVERTVAKTFGTARPRLVMPNAQTPISWTDVLRASLSSSDFELQMDGMYRCLVRGALIEISPDNYFELLGGVTERLLQPLQNLSEKQREDRVRLKLSSYLHQTQETLTRCKSCCQP